jgi:hypothetical protein
MDWIEQCDGSTATGRGNGTSFVLFEDLACREHLTSERGYDILTGI